MFNNKVTLDTIKSTYRKNNIQNFTNFYELLVSKNSIYTIPDKTFEFEEILDQLDKIDEVEEFNYNDRNILIKPNKSNASLNPFIADKINPISSFNYKGKFRVKCNLQSESNEEKIKNDGKNHLPILSHDKVFNNLDKIKSVRDCFKTLNESTSSIKSYNSTKSIKSFKSCKNTLKHNKVIDIHSLDVKEIKESLVNSNKCGSPSKKLIKNPFNHCNKSILSDKIKIINPVKQIGNIQITSNIPKEKTEKENDINNMNILKSVKTEIIKMENAGISRQHLSKNLQTIIKNNKSKNNPFDIGKETPKFGILGIKDTK